MLNSKAWRAMLLAVVFFAAFTLARPEGAKPEVPDKSTSTTPQPPPTDPDDKPTPADSKRIFDFKLTPDMKTADFDNAKSPLRKLLAFIVKGKSDPSKYLSLLHHPKSPSEVQVGIQDDSIFVPGDKPENAQNGFRRTDINMAVDPSKAFTGTTTFYQTIRFDPQAKLNLTTLYLLASIEVSTGDHIYDIVTGTDFKSENLAYTAAPNSNTIRVRNLATKELYSIPLDYKKVYNFAVTVDWTGNMLSVYASTGSEPLKMVGAPVANDPKAKSTDAATKGEWHMQLIKFPFPNPKDKEADRGDVPHKGLQFPIKGAEHVFFSNVFVTSGKEIEQPKFSPPKHSKCRN